MHYLKYVTKGHIATHHVYNIILNKNGFIL